MPAVSVVSGTGALRRDHRGPQRRQGGALLAERRALVRLFQALEHLPADAHRRFLRLDVVHLKQALGVVRTILVAQLVTALRNNADAAPLAIANLEHLVD